jgi:hypothetical protein
MQRHIAEVLAAGNQEFEDFIKRWAAWKFQNAGVSPEGLSIEISVRRSQFG